jgi:hypothetical protein
MDDKLAGDRKATNMPPKPTPKQFTDQWIAKATREELLQIIMRLCDEPVDIYLQLYRAITVEYEPYPFPDETPPDYKNTGLY